MAEQVLMLALSPTMEEGTIASWRKQEGEQVSEGDVLCEVETDKATMDYESVGSGTLLKILVEAGGQARVGQPIAIIGESGEDVSALVEEARKAAAQQGGEAPAPPAQAPPQGPAAGVAEAAKAPAAPRGAAPAPSRGGGDGRVKASPLARRLAEERGVDLRTVAGSGPGGRVVKRDLEGAPAAAAPTAAAPALEDRLIPVSQKRRIIAKRLAESKFSAPHYYLKIDVAVDALLAARERLNAARAPQERVSFNAFLVKFVAEALRRHPEVNSGWEGEAIHRFGSIDIGLAVAQQDGLITPVVRGCGGRGVLEIDRELRGLVEKARTNRLSPGEYTGATFTISSLGSSGILEFTAIINPPGSAILAVGRVRKVPVVDEAGAIAVQSSMILTLSCDHRVVDGAVGAAFLADLKSFIEDPIQTLY